jgi:hypothetical protein
MKVMSTSVQTRGNGNAEIFLVVSRTQDGYRVYDAAQPKEQHFVNGDLTHPACTCDAFAEDVMKGGTCEHYRAVCEQFAENDPAAREERAAIQAEGQPSPKRKRKMTNNGSAAVMTLKRSVSPDGRIDSLSVELSCPIEGVSAADINSRAGRMLKLQREIAGNFLKANGNDNSNGRGSSAPPQSENAVAAKILSIGATRNGNFSLSFQVNGKGAKLFGRQTEVAEAIRAAGFNYSPEDVAEGVFLNLPCRVVTKPTADGRYLNVSRVLPMPQRRGS